MLRRHRVIRDLYRDSVSLMDLSRRLGEVDGVVQASAVMATAANLDLVSDAGLLPNELEAGPNDLLIVVEGEHAEPLDTALEYAEDLLEPAAVTGVGGYHEMPPRSLEMALGTAPDINLALVSTPGLYAAAEAEKALRLGLNVMLFSDNVAIEDEVRLKKFALDHGLLLMGPDCGSAIIGGVPLGFANVVRRGGVGVVAASGTGLQQVTCLIDHAGAGISQAIGTGGRDLATEVGGMTMTAAIETLAADPRTEVIVLVSKPPAAEVAERVVASAASCGKPAVVNFFGASAKNAKGIHFVETLEDAATRAVEIVNGTESATTKSMSSVESVGRADLAASQRFIRGLYSGGTFCYEAQVLLRVMETPVYSATPLDHEHALDDPWSSVGHTIVDLGDDVFTRGRPHPMIDHRLRNQRILREAEDPETAVILLDVVLGYGSHADPAAEMAPVIRNALEIATAAGRCLRIVGSICGTEGDPQNLHKQAKSLADAGMILAPSNAAAVRLAAGFVVGRV